MGDRVFAGRRVRVIILVALAYWVVTQLVTDAMLKKILGIIYLTPLNNVNRRCYVQKMENTEDFKAWYNGLSADELKALWVLFFQLWLARCNMSFNREGME